MYKNIIYLIACISVFSLVACEDVVEVDFDNGSGTYLNIDAMLNNLPRQQCVRLVETSGFVNATAPQPVTGATVVLSDANGTEYAFTDADADGCYTWAPSAGQSTFGQEVGTVYTLSVTAKGTTYTATTTIAKVPTIDSMGYESEPAFFGDGTEHNAIFYARDLLGQTDYYWVKTFINGQAADGNLSRNKLAIDGAYDEGTSDGLLFIPPIRYFASANFEDDDPQFLPGDTLRAEIHAIDKATNVFLAKSVELLNNGGQFAVPYYNPGNNFTASVARPKVLGWFNIANVAWGEVVATE
jgi:hypothetical protein